MIRLIFGKNFNQDKKMISKPNYFNLTAGTHRTSDEVSKIIDDFPLIDNYISFIDALQKESYKRVAGIYEIQIDNDIIYVFKKDNYEYVKFIMKYKPENAELLTLTKDLFKLNGKNTTYLSISRENNFNILGPCEVLRVIYAYTNVKANGEEPFVKFKHRSKNGKIRDIIAPHEDVKGSLRPLNVFLQNVYDNRNDIQIAYKRGKCVKDGALKHKDNQYVFNMDLKDFYPSCKRELVQKYTNFLFRSVFNRDLLEEKFLEVILIDDGLFIGSPISGTLANAILSKTIMYLNMICKKYDVVLSVYADDISFSSKRFISEDFVMGMFNEAFIKYGLDSYFKINSKKSLGYSGSRRKVTGVSINDKNEVTVPRRYYRELRVLLDKLDKGDNSINVQQLKGKIAYALMIDDTGKIINYLKKYKSTVQHFSLYSGNL